MSAREIVGMPNISRRQAKGVALSVSTIARRIIAAIEPWYDWGTIHVERMEGSDPETMNPGGEGPVRFVQLQWFGVHIGFQIGRTPKKWSR